jgi:RNA polymerase-binding transcription factor DksA
MATASRKSLASRAGAAARKVVSRTSTAAAKKTAAKAPAKKTAAAAKKTAVKKAPAKKAPAKKVAATKAPAKKTAAKKAPAKAPAKKAAAKKVAVKADTAKKAVAKKAAVQKAPAKAAPAKKAAPATKTAATKATATPAKKAATPVATKRAASPSKLMVLDAEESWTKAELDGVRRQLKDDVERLTGELVEVEGDLAGMIENSGEGAGNDQADVGSASFERDQEMVIVNNARDMLVQSQHALERIANGTYGQCEICGNPIGKNRLMAFPRATLCLSCKQREERR